MPYQHGNLVDEIHETSPPCLPELFGAIPLHMYIHGAKNIRAGRATFYKAGTRSDDLFVSDAARERFKRLTKVTLITGALNRLWHRDSIDRMYEWLRRGPRSDCRNASWPATDTRICYGASARRRTSFRRS
jgi:hypothetical protein